MPWGLPLSLGALAHRHMPVHGDDEPDQAALSGGSVWPAWMVPSSILVRSRHPRLLSLGDSPPLALPAAVVPSGMMSFPCWLWHWPLGHGCWPRDREKMDWTHGDDQMGSQGGRKDAASKSLLFPFSATAPFQTLLVWSCTGTATTP